MQKRLIVSDPAVMMGKPVIVGTRITVELILEKLAAGETVEQILDAHPRLTREAIRAALAFAAEALRADVIYPTAEAVARTFWQTRAWTVKSLTVFDGEMAKEIIFLVEDAAEGGYVARALSYSIFTEADTWEELKQAVRDAVQCHFDEGEQPDLIRL
jgi:uncharacterized protein (DUF433 family)